MRSWLKLLELWLERQPADNPISRAVDRRRKNDRLIVEAVDGERLRTEMWG